MSEFVVLDTDVASASFKRRLPPSLLAQLVGTDACITFVTLGELTKWARLRQWGYPQPRRARALAAQRPGSALRP